MTKFKPWNILFAVMLLVLFSGPVYSEAALPPSTTPKTLHASDRGFWVLSQPAYRDSIRERAIQYSEIGREEHIYNMTDLPSHVEIRDMTTYSYDRWAVLTDNFIQIYDRGWNKVNSVSVSGTPEFMASVNGSFYLIDRMHEGGERAYYLQRVDHTLNHFSSKKRIGENMKFRGIERHNSTWIALSPSPRGASLKYFDDNWSLTDQRDVSLSERSPGSSLVDIQVSRDAIWILTSEDEGFGGQVHKLTLSGRYTAKTYDIGLEEEDIQAVNLGRPVDPDESDFMVLAGSLVIASMVILGLALIIFVAIPYLAWQRFSSREVREEIDGEKIRSRFNGEKEESGEEKEGESEEPEEDGEEGEESEEDSEDEDEQEKE